MGESYRGPTFTRKTHKKNSNLRWGATGFGGFCEAKLDEHMQGLSESLSALFREHLKSLPRNSFLSSGGVFGSWYGCPNELADVVERMVRQRHAEYAAAQYDKW